MRQTTINKEELIKDYVEYEFSTYDCAKKYDVHPSTIRNILLKEGITLRKRNQYTSKRLEKLKTNENLGSNTKAYYDKIKETGEIPENEKIRRQKVGEWSKNFKRTKKHKQKIGNSLLGNTNCLGREVSQETRDKISGSLKELYKDKTKHPLYRKHHSETTKAKIAKSHLKENLSDEALQAYRESAIKRIERQIADGLPVTPSIGRNEKEIIDKYEKLMNCKFERQFRVVGFFVDGYCKEQNIVIEVDEDYHKKRKEQDIYREEIIRRELNCDIIRIRD